MPFLAKASSASLLICFNSFVKTVAAERKLVPLSEYILVKPGLLALNLIIAMITELVSRLKTDSEWTEHVWKHVKIAIQTFCFALVFIRTKKGPIRSIPQ